MIGVPGLSAGCLVGPSMLSRVLEHLDDLAKHGCSTGAGASSRGAPDDLLQQGLGPVLLEEHLELLLPACASDIQALVQQVLADSESLAAHEVADAAADSVPAPLQQNNVAVVPPLGLAQQAAALLQPVACQLGDCGTTGTTCSAAGSGAAEEASI
jgi:hypothetical protein